MDKIKISLDALTRRVNKITGRRYAKTTVSTARGGGKGSLHLKGAILMAMTDILMEEAKKVSGAPK